jgi:DNA-directed RNA polymerase specialized sigma24 family protein
MLRRKYLARWRLECGNWRPVVKSQQAEATLVLVRADGTQRLLTRAQLSAAVDGLRPRQRQIIRLTLEERWPRQRVCEYLNHISVKTLMRDQIEALDFLTEL